MRCLYGKVFSINVKKFASALSEINLNFDWIDKDGSVGSIDTTKYRKINPSAQNPTVDDNGILLRQSNQLFAILHTLITQLGFALSTPKTTKKPRGGCSGRQLIFGVSFTRYCGV
ncbi:hypothetical protein OAJ93_01440 [Gammaproteobacteria bacterium]|nr:hypothetical protein [Gammaproteobacteria bacterium]